MHRPRPSRAQLLPAGLIAGPIAARLRTALGHVVLAAAGALGGVAFAGEGVQDAASGDATPLQDALRDDPDARAERRLARKLRRLEPADDPGWRSEEVASRLKPWLEAELGPRLSGAEAAAAGEPESWIRSVADDVRCGPLPGAALGAALDEARGRSGLAAYLEQFTDGLDVASVGWKVIAIEELPQPDGEDADAELQGEQRWLAQVRVWALGALEPSGERAQRNAAWTGIWREEPRGPQDAVGALVLERLAIEPTGDVAGEREPLFTDVTAEVLGSEQVWVEHLRPGLDHWQHRIESNLGISFLGHQGLAVGDVDGDGIEEILICQPGGLPNVLLERRPDGSAVDGAAARGLDFLDTSRAALFCDFDRDGDVDLVCSLGTDIVFFENDGQGNFTERFAVEAGVTTSLAAADYDGDGDVDVYVCGYVDPYSDRGAPTPYHDANNGQANLLLRNDIDPDRPEAAWSFEDVTVEVGLDQNNRRFSFAASWEDYDGDGHPDLYVANDFGRNNLYRNEGGRFRDVAAELGVEDMAAGMGVSWGDWDGDGDFDLYVSNMYSAAGRRVTFDRAFRPGDDEASRAAYRRHARGNTLFENLGGELGFVDVTETTQAEFGRWAWGGQFCDVDLDGRLDLVIPNGFLTGTRYDDL